MEIRKNVLRHIWKLILTSLQSLHSSVGWIPRIAGSLLMLILRKIMKTMNLYLNINTNWHSYLVITSVRLHTSVFVLAPISLMGLMTYYICIWIHISNYDMVMIHFSDFGTWLSCATTLNSPLRYSWDQIRCFDLWMTNSKLHQLYIYFIIWWLTNHCCRMSECLVDRVGEADPLDSSGRGQAVDKSQRLLNAQLVWYKTHDNIYNSL